jgi:uncharacterized membrane protein YfcA
MTFSVFDEILLTFGVGSALGFFGGLFGIGGGIIAIPMFVLGFGMEQPIAQGTALVLMVPNLVGGWWRYSQRHPVGWRAALTIAVSGTATTALLAHFATSIDPVLLRYLFCLFIAILAIRLLMRHRHSGPTEGASLQGFRLSLVGMLGGSSMGLLGIGGGLVATPLIIGWLKQRQTVAQSLSLALVAPSSAVALLTYARAGHVAWSLGLPMAVGGLLTVSAGVAVAHRLPERRMRQAFAWMMVGTAAWMAAGPLVMR